MAPAKRRKKAAAPSHNRKITKTSQKSGSRTSKSRILKSRKSSLSIGVMLLFGCGIVLGAFTLNRIYVTYQHDVQDDYSISVDKPNKNRTEHRQPVQSKNTQVSPAKSIAQKTSTHTKPSNDPSSAQSRVAASKEQVSQSLVQSVLPFKPSKRFSGYTPSDDARIMAIVIDDVGDQRLPGERTLALPGKLTVAVLPFTPYGPRLAKQAGATQKEVMLHAPMQPKKLSRWGEGLHGNMNEEELRSSLATMLSSVPNIVGVNNHMGSFLTEDLTRMNWVMKELPKHGLYFIDSRTSAETTAYEAAKRAGIPSYMRDIFLDHSRDIEDIDKQFDKLIERVNRQGMALGIGHPYPETLYVLERRLPELHALGIELVTVSELLNAQQARRRYAGR